MNIVEIGLRISMELGLKTGRFGIPCGIRPKKNIYYGIRPNVKMDFGFSSNETSDDIRSLMARRGSREGNLLKADPTGWISSSKSESLMETYS